MDPKLPLAILAYMRVLTVTAMQRDDIASLYRLTCTFNKTQRFEHGIVPCVVTLEVETLNACCRDVTEMDKGDAHAPSH